jgi:hypothetical protein
VCVCVCVRALVRNRRWVFFEYLCLSLPYVCSF